MKKKSKPDLLGVMAQIQESLAMLEKKMDLVIEKTVLKATPVNSNKPNSSSSGPSQPQQNHQNPPRRERQLYEAICADCSKVCEVPFQPREDRPVYCKECFAKRKGGAFQKPNLQNAAPSQTLVAVHVEPALLKKKSPKAVKKTKKKR